jgi:methylated-DNA-[protein]-cysteine S-methyltransferase
LPQQAKIFAYAIFNTDWGWMGIITSDLGIRHITLPRNSPQTVYHLISSYLDQIEPDDVRIGDLPQRLKSYLNGQRVAFTDRLDMAHSTQFQQAAWITTRSIPYAETRSYAWVARQMGIPRAARAVGQALAHNRLPIIIPCHRVIASDGSLGGFGGGLELKQRLLQMEYHSQNRGKLP